MVVLIVKRTNARDEYLFETTVSASIDSLRSDLCEIHNGRIKVLRLSAAVRELAAHGPLRPEETRGLSSDVAKLSDLDVHAYGVATSPDEYGQRTGVPPAPEIAAILNSTSFEAEQAVAKGKTLTMQIIKEQLDILRGAVMIAYPAYHRLPSYDPARLELEGKEELDGQSDLQDSLDTQEASLWWANRELPRNGILGDSIGKNEKTKIIVKLQSRSAGAPVREPRIDEETHKAMLAFYYKKQEEEKALKNDEDDSYLASQWANPKGLKSGLVNGGRDLSWKMG